MSGSSPPSPPARTRRLVIDRWEGEVAVAEQEDGTTLDVPRWLLPPGAREGDVVVIETEVDGSGALRHVLRLDAEATRAARGAAEAILARLRSRDPGGDITL